MLGVGIKVGAGRIELGGVRVGSAADLGEAGDAGLGAGRVIEEHAIAGLHLVAHEVARLVVPDPGPWQGASPLQVEDGSLVGLGLHQPVAHRRSGSTQGKVSTAILGAEILNTQG